MLLEVYANDSLAEFKLLPSLGSSFLLAFRTSNGRLRLRSRDWKLNDCICHQDLECRVIITNECPNLRRRNVK